MEIAHRFSTIAEKTKQKLHILWAPRPQWFEFSFGFPNFRFWQLRRLLWEDSGRKVQIALVRCNKKGFPGKEEPLGYSHSLGNQ